MAGGGGHVCNEPKSSAALHPGRKTGTESFAIGSVSLQPITSPVLTLLRHGLWACSCSCPGCSGSVSLRRQPLHANPEPHSVGLVNRLIAIDERPILHKLRHRRPLQGRTLHSAQTAPPAPVTATPYRLRLHPLHRRTLHSAHTAPPSPTSAPGRPPPPPAPGQFSMVRWSPAKPCCIRTRRVSRRCSPMAHWGRSVPGAAETAGRQPSPASFRQTQRLHDRPPVRRAAICQTLHEVGGEQQQLGAPSPW